MALPKLTQPEFEITLPVIKRKIKFRPFLVKEEKLLLIGKEGDVKDQLSAMKQVLSAVVLSPKNFDPDDLTVTDIEYLFMHLRGKSVDNIVKLRYKDNEDEQVYDFEVDINEVEPTFAEDRKHDIPVGNLVLELRDPTLRMMIESGISIDQVAMSEDSQEESIKMDSIFNMLALCLVKVYDDEQVYDDFSHKEAIDFLKSIDVNSFQRIQNFFENGPKLEHKIEYKNNLGNDREIVLRGLSDFF